MSQISQRKWLKTIDIYDEKVYTMGKYRLTPEQVKRIEEILEKGDRIELIPAKEKVKIVQEVRREIK